MSAAIEPVPHDSDMPDPPCPKLWISVLAPKRAALRTNPDGRCGRRPMVVRMIRSHDAFTTGKRTGGRRGANCGVAAAFGAHPSSAKPAAAMPPNLRRFRRFIAGG